MADNIDCREASRLLSIAYDRDLIAQEIDALQYHLGRCSMCRGFDLQLKFLRTAAERFRSAGD